VEPLVPAQVNFTVDIPIKKEDLIEKKELI
jgi:hypothetical protein